MFSSKAKLLHYARRETVIQRVYEQVSEFWMKYYEATDDERIERPSKLWRQSCYDFCQS